MKSKKPHWIVSLIPFLFLILSLAFVVSVFKTDALSGGSQVALLISTGVATAISMIFYRIPWKSLEKAISNNLQSIGTAILILLLIGAISGSWMISGVVPTLIYYGVRVITPGIFLFATCLICALVSLVTGSSWTTVATIGVALIGIGTAHGYAPEWIAGAIISGSYFGDKISPLSDTTVLASSNSGTPLFEHIRYMLITTVPSFTITLIIFLIVSLTHECTEASQAIEFTSSLKETFNISPWLLIVPIFTGVLIAFKLPALITLFLSALVAGITALIAQPEAISTIAGYTDGASVLDELKGLFITFYGHTSIDSGNEALNNLISTRGMTGMLNTIFLILCASAFSGVMMGSGMIQSITEKIMKHLKRPTSTVAATVGTGIFTDMVCGDQYLSILLTSSLYKRLYEENGLESRLLSRSTEDSATVISALIPWNSCGMTQSTVLRVKTIDYLPYCFFNLLSPIMSILIAATGYKIYRKIKPAE